MIPRRGVLAGLAGMFLAGTALAQEPAPGAASPTRPQAPRRPRPRRRTAPEPQAAPSAPAAPAPTARRGDPAPVPNREIEGPRRAPAPPQTGLNPALIDPRDVGRGSSNLDPNSYQERQDRLFRNPAPGARFSVPFSY